GGSNPPARTIASSSRSTEPREASEGPGGTEGPPRRPLRPDATETRLKAGHVFREHALAGSIPASPTDEAAAASPQWEARQLVKPAGPQTAVVGVDSLAPYPAAGRRVP